MANNEWLEYTVNVPTAGIYTIDIRVASNTTGGNFHIEFDGVDKTGNVNVPVTGGWQNWTTVSATATLSAGTHIMRFSNADSPDEYNINYFDISVDKLAPICDFDGSGIIDLSDIYEICLNWLSSWPDGDAGIDGSVDMIDFAECSALWQTNSN